MARVIGLVYDRSEEWIAGSYYIENLIFALKNLPADKPVIKLFTHDKALFDSVKSRTSYPHIIWVDTTNRSSFVDRLINKVSYTILRKHWIIRTPDKKVDILFPSSGYYLFNKINIRLFWIPDFQEKYYPQFFSADEVLRRDKFVRMLVAEKHPIVLSSQHAYRDFLIHYPFAQNKVFVLPFAVTLPSLEGIKIDDLRSKYKLEGPYFICSNQFWAHKNHLVVFKAVKELITQGLGIRVVFTGKPRDGRNPGYYDQLMHFVKNNNLQNILTFLGFIDRKDQLVLMQHSVAVIQPSLFEGWSTVVEDAKALNVPLIASDIEVHREQGVDLLFQPDNPKRLAERMLQVVDNRPSLVESNYNKKVLQFGLQFMDIVEKLTYA